MEWIQVFTIIASILAGIFVFYRITGERIDRLETFHREDMKSMDSKWERLFERLLLKENKSI